MTSSDLSPITYAIGDVHGCLAKLRRLLAKITDHAAGRPTRLIFLGDYIDRGPDSRGVIDCIMALQRERPDSVIGLRGNHEAIALMAVAAPDEYEEYWRMNGGATTLTSFDAMRADELPAETVAWMDALPYAYDDGRHYFVHAGVDPTRTLSEQNDHDRIWIREPFLSSHAAFERLIVHGHTPLMTAKPDIRANRINLDTGAVYGGPLTAAAFVADKREPIGFLTDD
ncbi:MAG: metallophosphoesterase family protein [Variibacter sp.]